MKLANRRILVVGMARSGIAAAQLLMQNGATPVLSDRKKEDAFGSELDALRNTACQFRLGEDPVKLLSEVDGLVISPGVPTAALCYGHIPLMLTRACPLQNVHGCTGCNGEGRLRDRKGRDFPVRCSAPGMAGVRTVYNPVPLYMGDRLREMPVDLALAAFTTEPPARVRQILERLTAGAPFDSEFTRGLYYTG